MLVRDNYDRETVGILPWAEIPDTMVVLMLSEHKKDIKKVPQLTEGYAINFIKNETDRRRKESAIAWFRKIFQKDDSALRKLFEKPLEEPPPF